MLPKEVESSLIVKKGSFILYEISGEIFHWPVPRRKNGSLELGNVREVPKHLLAFFGRWSRGKNGERVVQGGPWNCHEMGQACETRCPGTHEVLAVVTGCVIDPEVQRIGRLPTEDQIHSINSEHRRNGPTDLNSDRITDGCQEYSRLERVGNQSTHPARVSHSRSPEAASDRSS